jgi:DNA-binding HxlR family transcriptional regulator
MTVSKTAGRIDRLKAKILEVLQQEPPPRGRRVWSVRLLCHRVPGSPPLIGRALRQLEHEGAVERGIFRSIIKLTEKGRELAEGNHPGRSGHAD